MGSINFPNNMAKWHWLNFVKKNQSHFKKTSFKQIQHKSQHLGSTNWVYMVEKIVKRLIESTILQPRQQKQQALVLTNTETYFLHINVSSLLSHSIVISIVWHTSRLLKQYELLHIPQHQTNWWHQSNGEQCTQMELRPNIEKQDINPQLLNFCPVSVLSKMLDQYIQAGIYFLKNLGKYELL